MTPAASSLTASRYGTSGIRLVKLERRRDRHEVKDLTVSVQLQGAFDAAYTDGRNRDLVPADTMKNAVLSLAHDRLEADIETFGLELASHFLQASASATAATIEIREQAWRHVTVREKPYGHAFAQPGLESRVALVTRTRMEAAVTAGLDGLALLKTANAAFWGFGRDRYTTLKESRDCLLATVVGARWTYEPAEQPFEAAWRGVRQTLIEAFADHSSQSVQHTLYGMGDAVIQEHLSVRDITLTMPSRHHVTADLSPFGQDNRNEIFVPTEEPLGLIEGTVKRT